MSLGAQARSHLPRLPRPPRARRCLCIITSTNGFTIGSILLLLLLVSGNVGDTGCATPCLIRDGRANASAPELSSGRKDVHQRSRNERIERDRLVAPADGLAPRLAGDAGWTGGRCQRQEEPRRASSRNSSAFLLAAPRTISRWPRPCPPPTPAASEALRRSRVGPPPSAAAVARWATRRRWKNDGAQPTDGRGRTPPTPGAAGRGPRCRRARLAVERKRRRRRIRAGRLTPECVARQVNTCSLHPAAKW